MCFFFHLPGWASASTCLKMFACVSPNLFLYLPPFTDDCPICTTHVQLSTEMAHSLGTSIIMSRRNVGLNSFYHMPKWASELLDLLDQGSVLLALGKRAILIIEPCILRGQNCKDINLSLPVAFTCCQSFLALLKLS